MINRKYYYVPFHTPFHVFSCVIQLCVCYMNDLSKSQDMLCNTIVKVINVCVVFK